MLRRRTKIAKRPKLVVIYRPDSVLQRAERALRERDKAKDKAFMRARRAR